MGKVVSVNEPKNGNVMDLPTPPLLPENVIYETENKELCTFIELRSQ